VRRAARTDGNQGAIVDALRAIGATVCSLAACGKGIPDLLIGYRAHNYLIEVKNPDKPAADRALTDDQVIWHDGWQGVVHVVETPAQALQVVRGSV